MYKYVIMVNQHHVLLLKHYDYLLVQIELIG